MRPVFVEHGRQLLPAANVPKQISSKTSDLSWILLGFERLFFSSHAPYFSLFSVTENCSPFYLFVSFLYVIIDVSV